MPVWIGSLSMSLFAEEITPRTEAISIASDRMITMQKNIDAELFTRDYPVPRIDPTVLRK